MGKTVSVLILCLLAICMLAFPSTYFKPVYAAATTVTVSNASTGSNTTVASLHDSFTLNVSIENSPANLAGYQFTLVWNASILNCTSYTITPPQEWGSNWYAARNILNRTNSDGTQSYWVVVVSYAGHVNIGPNHIINTFTFSVIGTGATTLVLRDVVLGDWNDISIPVIAVPGLFETLVGPIYILPDGSISPSIAPIQRNGSTYTLTGNITSNTDGIIVQKSNVTIDGATYTLQGSGGGSGYGFNLTGINHVTIRNTRIANFSFGISLVSSSNNTISGNYVTGDAMYGIYLYGSSNYNTVSGNSVTNNKQGGIYIWSACDFDNVSGNNVANNNLGGIYFEYSSSNTISGNNVTSNNSYGIWLESSGDNTVSGNNVANNGAGIGLELSVRNSVSGNNVTPNNYYGVILQSSSRNSISGNSIRANNLTGITLYGSSNNTLSENTVKANNYYGIMLGYYSSYNFISGNNVTANNRGIEFNSSSDNTIFRNNFINNTVQAYSLHSTNVWDDGSKGNYWSDYLTKYPNATEIDSTGVGNTPYVINVNNTDHYPLMNQPVIPEFSPYLILPLMMMATLLAVMVCRRKHNIDAIPV